MIDVYAHADSRDIFIATMLKVQMPGGFGTVFVQDADGTVHPNQWVAWDDIGEIVATPAVLDAQGNVVTPATYVPGYHANLRAWGPIEELLTAGMAQVDADGNPLGLFARTHILDLLGTMTIEQATADGIPAGEQGASGVRIYDPANLRTPARVWM